MLNGEKANLLQKAQLIRCDRCMNKSCGHYDADPIESNFRAVGGEDSFDRLMTGSISSFIDWATYGFCAFEVAQWYGIGVFRTEIAHKLLKAGISITDFQFIVTQAILNRNTAEKLKQLSRGGISDEVRKRGKNIPQGTTK